MPKFTISSLISNGGKFALLVAIIGAVILGVGKIIFPETPVKEYLTITTIFSIILALVILSIIESRKKKGGARHENNE